MLNEISYYPIFGYPLILYLGLIAVVLFLATASMSTILKAKIKNHFNVHRSFAILSILVALIHGILGILAYL